MVLPSQVKAGNGWRDGEDSHPGVEGAVLLLAHMGHHQFAREVSKEAACE